jgi:hypothetical protein
LEEPAKEKGRASSFATDLDEGRRFFASFWKRLGLGEVGEGGEEGSSRDKEMAGLADEDGVFCLTNEHATWRSEQDMHRA